LGLANHHCHNAADPRFLNRPPIDLISVGGGVVFKIEECDSTQPFAPRWVQSSIFPFLH